MQPTGRTASGEAVSFDRQAPTFDRRAGLPAAPVEEIAAAVAEAAGLGPGGLLLEVGAGTGEIGARLAAALACRGGRYLGLDLSLPMLAEFRRRLAEESGEAALLRADADATWPLAGGRIGALFASRSAHLLEPDHLAAEARRVLGAAGGAVILGRVRREPDSVRASMRREMRRLLAGRGIAGRGGKASRLEAALEAAGGRPAAVRAAASWQVEESPAGSLAAWRSKAGLAGVAVAPEVQREVLDALAAWARQRYGDLRTGREAMEHYELTAVHLPPRPG